MTDTLEALKVAIDLALDGTFRRIDDRDFHIQREGVTAAILGKLTDWDLFDDDAAEVIAASIRPSVAQLLLPLLQSTISNEAKERERLDELRRSV